MSFRSRFATRLIAGILALAAVRTGASSLQYCGLLAAPIVRLLAVKAPAALDDIDLQWQPDPSATGYNLWYVTRKDEIPLARQASSPPAIGVAGCSVPSPAPVPACTDPGAVPRGSPSVFFYQVRAHCCAAAAEGP